jgi:hypothetical protein
LSSNAPDLRQESSPPSGRKSTYVTVLIAGASTALYGAIARKKVTPVGSAEIKARLATEGLCRAADGTSETRKANRPRRYIHGRGRLLRQVETIRYLVNSISRRGDGFALTLR